MDGVILNSLDKLSSCLVQAVEPFCQSYEQFREFSKFDRNNPGLSRFEKTDFFLQSLPDNSHIKPEIIKKQILDQFDSLSLDARISSEIDEAIYTLTLKIPPRNLILLSNCDNNQLRVLSVHFGLHRIFGGGIIGTPPSKKTRFENLLKKAHFNTFVSISDSESDAIIARSLGIQFAFIQNFARDEGSWLGSDEKHFQTLTEFILSID